MAVDKLKEFEDEVLELYNKGILTEQQSIDEISRNHYEDYAPKLFNYLVESASTFKSESYVEAQSDRELFDNGLDNYRQSRTNGKGEYAEGLSIYHSIERLVTEFPDIPELQGSAIARRLYEVGSAYRSSPKIFERYIRDLTDVQYFIIGERRKRLDPNQIEVPIPSILLKARTETASSNTKLNTKLFSAVFSEFLAYKIKNGLSVKLQAEYSSAFPIFLYFIGDKPIESITSKNIKDCLTACLKFPRRNLNLYKSKPIAELANMEIPKEHCLAVKSVDNFRKLIQGIFVFAKENEYIKQSPAQDLNLNFKFSKKKAAFSSLEVAILLNGALALKAQDEHRKWIVLLAAYTGARLGELVQLRPKDIKFDQASEIRYLLITPDAGSVKTDEARVVPIHSKLLELGFATYVEKASGEGRLFSNIPNAKSITSWFPAFMKSLAILKLNDLGQSRTFHSFRHSFITEARGNGQSTDLVQAIVGHEKTSAGQTDVYTGHFTVEKLLPVVESIEYL